MSRSGVPQERTQRFAGVSGVLYFFVTVAATALVVSTGTTEQQMELAAAGPFLRAMAESPVAGATAMFGYAVSMVLLVAFALALHRLLAREAAIGTAAPAAVGFGAVLFTVESLLTVGLVLELAPAYVEAGVAQQAALGTVAATLLSFRSYAALTGGALVALGAGAFGLTIRRHDLLPAWLGTAAVLLGSLGLVGALWPLVPALSYLRQVAYFLFAAWVLAVGILLLRR